MDNGSGEYKYDVAVTFAGEDRDFVDEVVAKVKAAGHTVFYDEDAKVDLWGEDLTEYFANVYERWSRYAVMFISSPYAQKAWTRLERRSVLARAMQQESPYLLPVRLDSTDLPGVRGTVGFLDGLQEGAGGIAGAIVSKLAGPSATGKRLFNGRVPRTQQELGVLLGERPAGWEYLLFSSYLCSEMEKFADEYRDHKVRFAATGDYVPPEGVITTASAQLARLSALTGMFEQLLLGHAQREALGNPGEPGDPELIAHLSKRFISVYGDLLRWSYGLRSLSTSTHGIEVFRSLSDWANQPIDEIRRFVAAFRDEMDGMNAKLEAGVDVHREEHITFVTDPAVVKRYQRAIKAFSRRR